MKKSTLIMLLLAVSLGAYVYFYEIKGGEERQAAEEKAKKIFSFEQGDIARISLNRGEDAFQFERRDDDWVITQPISSKADQSSVDAIARNLTTTNAERRLSVTEDKLATYGLKDPRISLTIKLKSGDQHRLRLGDEDFSGSNIYVLIDDGQEAALAPKYLFTSVDKSLFDLRDKSVIDVSQSEVNKLELKTPTGQFLVQKQDRDWRLQQPRQLLADSSQVSSILSKLSSAQMKEVVTEATEDLKEYGLDRPTITARLWTEKGGQQVLTLGSKAGEAYYAKTSSKSPVFKVNADVYDKLDTSLFDLRNKKPAPFERNDIRRVRVKNEHQTLVCEKNDEDKWIVREPAENKDKEVQAYKLFNPLEFNDAKEIVDEPSNSLTAKLVDPAIEVELTKKDGPPITISISKKEDDSVYVRSSLSSAVMKFEASLLDDLNFKIEDILQK